MVSFNLKIKIMLNRIFLKSLFFVIIFFTCAQIASADTSFTFSVPEGQSGSGNEFYHGRCVRVDVLLDTDGHDTGGADLEINYDNSRIAIVNDDCSTAATTIYPASQYDNYPNNHVTSNKITLGAYNNPGHPYNGNDSFAHFYFTVLDGGGDYDLDFEFTVGNTTDTNLAEYGSGNDILEHADSYTLHFADDDNTPYVNNENPANGATDVQVVSNILHRLNDDDAGVDFSSLTESLTGANWGITNYTAGSGQISHNCHVTNANRVPYCDTTLNPTNNLYYCENYTVDISVSDLGNPTVHTLNNYNYSFDTESDNDSAEIYNKNPNDSAVGVSKDDNIIFNIRDVANPGGYAGTGVDISTLQVTVSAPNWGTQIYTTANSELSANPISVNDYGNVYDYAIAIDPSDDFPENTVVTVTIDVDDYGCPTVNHQHDSYTFTTADTIGPVCKLFTPTPNVVNMGTSDNVTFHCTDSGVGVDIDTVSAIVDGIEYTSSGTNQFTYTGTPADYFITIDAVDDFSLEYALEVIVNARDFSGNASTQVSFGLATGVNGTCTTCQSCEKCEKCDDKKCDDKKNTKTIIKYENCNALKDFIKKDSDVVDILKAGSSIANTQISNITLTKINEFDVSSDTNLSIIVQDDIIIFEGTATPNTKVTLLIESEPIIVTGLSDDDGKWRIEMANIFPNGIHKVSAVSLSRDDYIIKSKFLSDFEVTRHMKCPWFCVLIIIILAIVCIILFYKYRKMIKKYKKLRKIRKN